MEKPFHVFRKGEGRRHSARGSVMHFKATAETTSGRFSFMERELPPGGRMPPPHKHPGEESYFVLEGEVSFWLAGLMRVEHAESFVLVPGGVGHTFGNVSSEPARLLVLHTPPLDAYFAELEELWSGSHPPTFVEERELMERHGMEPV